MRVCPATHEHRPPAATANVTTATLGAATPPMSRQPSPPSFENGQLIATPQHHLEWMVRMGDVVADRPSVRSDGAGRCDIGLHDLANVVHSTCPRRLRPSIGGTHDTLTCQTPDGMTGPEALERGKRRGYRQLRACVRARVAHRIRTPCGEPGRKRSRIRPATLVHKGESSSRPEFDVRLAHGGNHEEAEHTPTPATWG